MYTHSGAKVVLPKPEILRSALTTSQYAKTPPQGGVGTYGTAFSEQATTHICVIY